VQIAVVPRNWNDHDYAAVLQLLVETCAPPAQVAVVSATELLARLDEIAPELVVCDLYHGYQDDDMDALRRIAVARRTLVWTTECCGVLNGRESHPQGDAVFHIVPLGADLDILVGQVRAHLGRERFVGCGFWTAMGAEERFMCRWCGSEDPPVAEVPIASIRCWQPGCENLPEPVHADPACWHCSDHKERPTKS
jgi:hypothetical protein